MLFRSPTDNLYRIIGVFGENNHGVSGKQLVKLIKYDYANSNLLGTDGDYKGSGTTISSYYKGSLTSIDTYYWNNSAKNTWSTSLLNKTNLNINFINNIGSIWSNKIATTTWKVGGSSYDNIVTSVPKTAYQYEVGSSASATKYSAKIGLMYVSDYGFGASSEAWTKTMGLYNNAIATSTNWMYMGYRDWTISRYTGDSIGVFVVLNVGTVDLVDANDLYSVGNFYGVRPVFNLVPTVTYVSGSGTQSDPIRIN